MVNVTNFSIHGSYGYFVWLFCHQNQRASSQLVTFPRMPRCVMGFNAPSFAGTTWPILNKKIKYHLTNSGIMYRCLHLSSSKLLQKTMKNHVLKQGIWPPHCSDGSTIIFSRFSCKYRSGGGVDFCTGIPNARSFSQYIPENDINDTSFSWKRTLF